MTEEQDQMPTDLYAQPDCKKACSGTWTDYWMEPEVKTHYVRVDIFNSMIDALKEWKEARSGDISFDRLANAEYGLVKVLKHFQGEV